MYCYVECSVLSAYVLSVPVYPDCVYVAGNGWTV
jgi:hypothetical protein